MIVLSRLHPESISALSWNGVTLVRNFTSIANSAFPDRSTSFSMAQFRSQKKSNFPFRLFAANLRVWSDKQRFEGEIIGICPSRRFPERSKYLRVPVRSIFFSMEQFHTQKKSNVPFRLFADNLRVWSNKGIFEDELTGICPWRRFSARSKYSRRGSSNKEAGMLPFSPLDLRRSSCKFLRFVEKSIFFIIGAVSTKKSNILFRLVANNNLSACINKGRVEEEHTCMCPLRRLYERSKYSRHGSSNKEAGMLPLSQLDPRCSSLKFLRFLKAACYKQTQQ